MCFPENCIWSLGVAASRNSGGMIDKVDRACRPIRDAAGKGDAGTSDLMHACTAGQKWFRPAAYLCQVERILSSKGREGIPVYQ